MGLVELVRRLVEPPPRITMDEIRSARPLRSDDVDETYQSDGSVILMAPLALQGRGYVAWMAKRMNAPDKKSFELEPVGALVWSMCDGKNTFDSIARRLRETYKMNRLESDAALTAFLQMLGQRRLISLKMGKKK